MTLCICAAPPFGSECTTREMCYITLSLLVQWWSDVLLVLVSGVGAGVGLGTCKVTCQNASCVIAMRWLPANQGPCLPLQSCHYFTQWLSLFSGANDSAMAFTVVTAVALVAIKSCVSSRQRLDCSAAATVECYHCLQPPRPPTFTHPASVMLK